ncbi:hypothetical protein PYCCODRAFT_1467943 [Trametes coccinea BRFM310]|uniref:DUF6534 domain-containing protein n=1 Tax=Trametes coccinea (strain BRFM310) TaxID=1353009 RepID=A0A1Y2INM9_TRAC3|nr:hypothetical protein PYCCODRAFT_1467943 [Trametes coccinea BRFM310]
MDLNATIGSLFIGYIVSLCLFGITLSQVVLFFRNHRQKSKSLKAIVWIVCIFENVQVVAVSQGIWLYLVTYRTQPSSLAYPARSFGVLVYLTSINNLFVRCVYAYRVYKLNGRRIFFPLVVVALSSTVASLAIVYGTQGVRLIPWAEGHKFASIFYAGYACELSADLIITASIVYIFSHRRVRWRRRPETPSIRPQLGIACDDLRDLQHHRGKAVIHPSHLSLIATGVQYVAMPESFAFLAFYLALGKLYANSLLGALNARDIIFPRSRPREAAAAPSAPLLTSVVVMDFEETFVSSVDEEERASGSYQSDETRMAAVPVLDVTATGLAKDVLCESESEKQVSQIVHFG